MTYNFDLERWWHNQVGLLEARRNRGELDGGEFEAALDALDERLEEMQRRLDGSFSVQDPGISTAD